MQPLYNSSGIRLDCHQITFAEHRDDIYGHEEDMPSRTLDGDGRMV